VDPVRFEVGALVLTSPMTAGTNLLLTAQCAWSFARLRRGGTARSRLWGRFFLFLAGATLAGAPKHGLATYDGTSAYAALLLAVNLSTGLSTFFAQRAALEPLASDSCPARCVVPLVRAKLALFVLLLVHVRHFLLVLADTAAGLALALSLELGGWRSGRAGSGWIAAGLALGFLPAVFYVLRVPNEPWFGHVDLAHVLMMPSLALIHRGALGAAGRSGGDGRQRPWPRK
jgi:hypothetical protein